MADVAIPPPEMTKGELYTMSKLPDDQLTKRQIVWLVIKAFGSYLLALTKEILADPTIQRYARKGTKIIFRIFGGIAIGVVLVLAARFAIQRLGIFVDAHSDVIFFLACIGVSVVLWRMYIHPPKELPSPLPLSPDMQAYYEKEAHNSYSVALPIMFDLMDGMPANLNLEKPQTQAQMVQNRRFHVEGYGDTKLYFGVSKANHKLPCNTEIIKKYARSAMTNLADAGKIPIQLVRYNSSFYSPLTVVDVTADDLTVTFKVSPTTDLVLQRMTMELSCLCCGITGSIQISSYWGIPGVARVRLFAFF